MEDQSSPIPENDQEILMDFPSALIEILDGKKVGKFDWHNRNYYGYLKDERLTLHKPDGKDYAWILTEGDMAGVDYFVIN